MGIHLQSLDHKPDWSHLVDRVARYVDWCIQYTMMVRMARGGGQMFNVIDYVNGRMDRNALDSIKRLAKKEKPRGGGKTDIMPNYGKLAQMGYNSTEVVAKLREIGEGNWTQLARLAQAFSNLGGGFEKKAREYGVYREIGSTRVAAEFYVAKMFGEKSGVLPAKNEFFAFAPALG